MTMTETIFLANSRKNIRNSPLTNRLIASTVRSPSLREANLSGTEYQRSERVLQGTTAGASVKESENA